jgi:hypothetical protein
MNTILLISRNCLIWFNFTITSQLFKHFCKNSISEVFINFIIKYLRISWEHFNSNNIHFYFITKYFSLISYSYLNTRSFIIFNSTLLYLRYSISTHNMHTHLFILLNFAIHDTNSFAGRWLLNQNTTISVIVNFTILYYKIT